MLGRLDEAVAAYEAGIRRFQKLGDDQGVAIAKGQLGTVRMLQRRYHEALKTYEEARERFTRLGQLGSVAVTWHLTGVVYGEAAQPEAAEDAYRKSLAIEVRLGDVAGQASTLGQLGLLYDDELGRTEEAVAFFRQAVDNYVETGNLAGEGRQRGNLAIRLRKLRRFAEGRQEIGRTIECNAQSGHGSQPWSAWAVLADIETDTGNPTAATEAKHKAIECYLAYRRDDGENHNPDGRICLAVTERLLASDPAAAALVLQQVAADPKLAGWLRPFIQALQAIVAGSRDRSLADAPELDYSMAAEILFLLDRLEKTGK